MLKSKLKKSSESTIQRKTIDAFEKEGWLVVKNIQTNKNGWPDLTLYKMSVTLFIECKAEDVSEVRPLQLYRHNELRKQGFTVLIINNIKQINNAIETGSTILQSARH